MTIDERMDRLTERHEALTMNLELAARDIEAQRGRIDELVVLAKQDGENIRGLARVAELQHRRITALEGGAVE